MVLFCSHASAENWRSAGTKTARRTSREQHRMIRRYKRVAAAPMRTTTTTIGLRHSTRCCRWTPSVRCRFWRRFSSGATRAQHRSSENTEFLRGLYSRIKDEDLREKIMFSLSQQRGAGNEQWLMNIALDPKENIELRKKALFWAGQSGVAVSELARLYDRMSDTEMKEAIIFGLSQRQSDRAAIDKMFDIAKNEKDPDLRKKAIFWLGQSHDPRVQQFLIDLINR